MRSLARRVTELDAEIATLNRQLKRLVATAAPVTTFPVAVSTCHAGTLRVTAGQNIERLKDRASFAALAALAPIPIS